MVYEHAYKTINYYLLTEFGMFFHSPVKLLVRSYVFTFQLPV